MFASECAESERSPFRFGEVEAGSLGLWEGETPVLVYNYGPKLKPGVPEDRRRACYVHPLYGLDGEVLTDDFPPDHYHHRGLFWAWPHVWVGGKHYDPWTLRGMKQRFHRWLARKVDGQMAELAFENGWYSDHVCYVVEQVVLRVHGATHLTRLLDVELTLEAQNLPVVLKGADGKGYGGLTLRFAPRRATRITTPAGVQAEDLNLARLRWGDLVGQFGGRAEFSGAAIFVPPDHPDFPPQWITRHYGVLGVGWPGAQPGTLERGSPVTLSYRVVIHRGILDVGELEQLYRSYVHERRKNA